jgi:hypothetical protein
MDSARMVVELNAEITRLTQARDLLMLPEEREQGSVAHRMVAKRMIKREPAVSFPVAKRKNLMSAEARARISAAMKERWAAKTAKKPVLKK